AAVAYTAAITLDSTTAVATSSFAANIDELVADSDNFVRLPQATGIAALVADTDTSDSSKQRQLISALVAPKDLISLIPTLRALGRQQRPSLVIHVPVSSAADVSDVLAVRDSGSAILRSMSQQDAVDYAVAASIAAQRLGTPIVHCFPAESGDSAEFQGYAAPSTQEAIRAYLQAEKASDESAHDAVRQALAAVVGEEQELVSYFGAKDAQVVYVTFGNVVSQAAVSAVAGVGVVQISLARPLNPSALKQAVPASAKRVVALDQTRRAEAGWGPLFFDLALVAWEHRPILLNAVLPSSPAGLDTVTPEQLEAINAHALTLASPAHFNAAAVASIPEDASATPQPIDEGAVSEAATVGAYGQLLRDAFGLRLRVANASES
ncbi:sulfite reductase [NADPH] flavoprotein component, partial [Coemansia sp. RSA 2611]